MTQNFENKNGVINYIVHILDVLVTQQNSKFIVHILSKNDDSKRNRGGW